VTTPWIIDTTVLVAGLLTRNPDSPTARILDAMLAAQFTYLLSLELLAEYRRVLRRPKIRKRHGLDDAELDAFLEALARNAAVRTPSAASSPAPDPGDAHLWALLESDPLAVLITGDKPLLLADPPRPGAVCTPAAFAALVLGPPPS
jgi:putative PIN family toxin of toxin-antitoxin system